jgi:glycolate oxidase FAD binding subunit
LPIGSETVEPATVEEAAQVFARASREGLHVSIGREGGDLVLSTRRLNRVLEHEAGDLTVTVETGIGLRELNALLGERGQRLSLDPPGDPTVGATIAADLFGPLAHRYGRARDLLLGVTAVLPDGLVASSGGKVVKNVAGYDLGKLFVGSHGRLGLVARASFRLHPVPAAARTLVVEVDDPAEVQRLHRLLLHSELVPSAVDVLWPGRLALLFEGGERAVAEQLERARLLVGGREDGGAWAESAALQETAPARRAFGARELEARLREQRQALVRLGPTCFLFGEAAPLAWTRLAEHVRAELDPHGTLAWDRARQGGDGRVGKS